MDIFIENKDIFELVLEKCETVPKKYEHLETY